MYLLYMKELQTVEYWQHRCPNLDTLRQRTFDVSSPPIGVLATDIEKVLALAMATALTTTTKNQEKQMYAYSFTRSRTEGGHMAAKLTVILGQAYYCPTAFGNTSRYAPAE